MVAGGSDFEEEQLMFTLVGGSAEVFDQDLVILDDTEPERPESEDFSVEITSNSPLISQLRLTINPNSAVVTIIDNDGKFHMYSHFVYVTCILLILL